MAGSQGMMLHSGLPPEGHFLCHVTHAQDTKEASAVLRTEQAQLLACLVALSRLEAKRCVISQEMLRRHLIATLQRCQHHASATSGDAFEFLRVFTSECKI